MTMDSLYEIQFTRDDIKLVMLKHNKFIAWAGKPQCNNAREIHSSQWPARRKNCDMRIADLDGFICGARIYFIPVWIHGDGEDVTVVP